MSPRSTSVKKIPDSESSAKSYTSALSAGLARLGMTYKEYLRSEHWQNTKARYYAARRRECWVCGTKQGIHLHHITYKRLGAELLNDLVPLCGEHHDAFHKMNPGLFNLERRTKKFVRHESKAHLPKGIKRNLNGKLSVKAAAGKTKKKRFIGTFRSAEEAIAAQSRALSHTLVAKRKTVSLEGPPCPRCKTTMAVVKHVEEWTPPAKSKFYYKFWYRCTLKKCKTTQVMSEEGRVWL